VLGLDPAPEQGVGDPIKELPIQSVVVHEHAEAALAPIPDVPDERAVVEQLRVGGEEGLPQPRLQVPATGAGLGEEL
jgi:hypothetical protein